jgi:hypothetical protein
MFLVTLLGLAGLVAPRLVDAYALAAWLAGVIAAGALLTSVLRLWRIISQLRSRPQATTHPETDPGSSGAI